MISPGSLARANPKSLSLEIFVGNFVGNFVDKWAVSGESFDTVSVEVSDKDEILAFSDTSLWNGSKFSRTSSFSAYEGGLHGRGLDIDLVGSFESIL